MSAPDAALPARRRGIFALAPLIVFLALGVLLLFRLFAGDASRIPSALIGHPAPPIDLAGLPGAPGGLSDADLRAGHVSVVNIFGSWCAPCHEEHAVLLDLAADPALKAKGVRLYGVAQKDDPENVKRFLGARGDPFAKVGLDPSGRAGIDWGVYGVPETFVVRGDGTIAYKFVGPLTAETLASDLKPQIEKALN
jgi:cytochrome c biogenesis protein CcmG/thiol:disulfide interchange protein DsbE